MLVILHSVSLDSNLDINHFFLTNTSPCFEVIKNMKTEQWSLNFMKRTRLYLIELTQKFCHLLSSSPAIITSL